MATWNDIQAVLVTASTQLCKSFSKINSASSLVAWLQNALITYPNPLVKIVSASLVASLIVFVLSIPTNNYSWVDKSWSILPAYYAWVLALHTAQAFNVAIHPRLFLIAGLVSIWGIRLTYNFWRKGGYSLDGEDYRWPIIRKGMHPLLFQVFNFTFIAIIQNVLLASLLSPAYVVWTASYGRRNAIVNDLNEYDIIAFVVSLSLLVFETIADQQQWQFHQEKAAAITSSNRPSGDVAKGFLTSGLWKYSRHPNFFAEQAFWWSLSLFVYAATGKAYGWWMGGAAALTALFQGSTWLTESISASKYPDYAKYQETTSMLVPWFPKKTQFQRAEEENAARVSALRTAKETAAAVVDEQVEVVAAPVSRGRTARAAKSTGSSSSKKSASSTSRSRSRSVAAPKSKSKSTSTAPRSRSKSAARAPSTGARRRSTRKAQ